MRVLFLESHPMWIHGLPNGFKDAGHEVNVSGPLDHFSPEYCISEFKPDLIVTMGWGPENSSLYKQKMIQSIVGKVNKPHIYWSTEDPTHSRTFVNAYIKRLKPDFIFTICPSKVSEYRQAGIKAAHMDFGYHKSVHFPSVPQNHLRSSISVVANAHPKILDTNPGHFRHVSLINLIKPLLEKGMKIDFYGSNWLDMKRFLGTDIPKEWVHGYVPYTEAHTIYNSSDIVIGLQNHETQLTQRTYEILASGGFLFTSDTKEIRRLFTPHKDLIVSSSPKETVQFVEYYLNDPAARLKIIENGKASVSCHSYESRAYEMIRELRNEGIL
ncbi:glycosyltransferase [Rossellomorea marisflavi]|uniref:CgeB family protein n=1 Tax=Rossellomorea marisflavi TaxID=189381 RepID=UPI00351625EA